MYLHLSQMLLHLVANCILQSFVSEHLLQQHDNVARRVLQVKDHIIYDSEDLKISRWI